MAYSVKSKKSGKMYYLHTKDVILAAQIEAEQRLLKAEGELAAVRLQLQVKMAG